jgi:hypothetical protein
LSQGKGSATSSPNPPKSTNNATNNSNTNAQPEKQPAKTEAPKKETKAPSSAVIAKPISEGRPRVYFDVSIDNKTNDGFRIVMEVHYHFYVASCVIYSIVRIFITLNLLAAI